MVQAEISHKRTTKFALKKKIAALGQMNNSKIAAQRVNRGKLCCDENIYIQLLEEQRPVSRRYPLDCGISFTVGLP